MTIEEASMILERIKRIMGMIQKKHSKWQSEALKRGKK